MTIEIKKIINSSIAAFHSEGLEVFSQLQSAYNNKEQITLSFQGIERCATQFLNASIGKMYLQYDPALVDSLLHFDIASIHNLQEKIDEVKENAINSKEYDSLMENATSY